VRFVKKRHIKMTGTINHAKRSAITNAESNAKTRDQHGVNMGNKSRRPPCEPPCVARADVRCGWCNAALCMRHRDRHLCAKEPTGQGRIWWPI
jgi:hypothetical protein